MTATDSRSTSVPPGRPAAALPEFVRADDRHVKVRRGLAGRLEPVAFASALIAATFAFSAWSTGHEVPQGALQATPAPVATRGHAG